MILIIVLGVVSLSSEAVKAADGDLDPSFDTDGRVMTDLGTLSDQVSDVAIQDDGKIIVVGETVGALEDYAVVRYNSDGSLDNTFSGDGIVQTDFGGKADHAAAVRIQSNGKIVVAGSSYSSNKLSVARYNQDGTLDTTFSGDGKVTSNFGTGNALAIQKDGKIVVAGINENSLPYDFGVVRFNSDGRLDHTFSDDGKVQTDFFGYNDWIGSVAIQEDGNIIVAGDVFDGSLHHFALARYKPDGSLDNSFSSDGKVTTHFPGSFHNEGKSLAIQRDGKIVVGGFIQFATSVAFGLARYNADGSLDLTFSGTGLVTTAFPGDEAVLYDLAIQHDDKIVGAGYSHQADSDFALARYNTDGSLDTSFSGDGILTTDFAATHEYAQALAIQPDGNIVAAGRMEGTGFDFAIARYLSTPPPTSALDDSYTTPEDTTLSVPPPGVLENDFDPQGDPLTAILQTGPSNGSLTLNSDGSFIYIPNSGFTGDDTFTYVANDGSADSNIATVIISVGCLFCDDFADGILDPNWSYIKPTWLEAGGFLSGTPAGRKAIAVASPIFTGCQICYEETSVMTAGGPLNTVWILGWYVDKRNTIELVIKEENDKIILKQRVNGVIVNKAKALVTINPNTPYIFSLAFDGSQFIVSMNGSPLFMMTPVGTVPTGTVGFQIKNTTASFEYIIVN